MGLLDDAIREHLDLKRRRGADPTEIERAEREALGPVRRVPDEREPLEPAADEPLAYDQGSESEWDEPLDEELEEEEEDGPAAPPDPGAARQAPVRAEGPAPPRELELDDERGHGDEDELFEDEEPFAAEERGARRPRTSTAEETVEYDVEDALEGDAGREDVLEETPEFLQDTPDHDRLWFEQRPPRDFDFNE